MVRAETTVSVASSFDQLHPKVKEKQKYKTKETADPLKVLDPVRKKLTSVEAQRVIAVVDDSIKRFELVSLLPFIVENLSRFSVILGSDLVQVLEDHDRIQSSFQKAVSKYELEQRRSQAASPEASNVSSRPSSSQTSRSLSEKNTREFQEDRIDSAGSKRSLSQRSVRLSPLQTPGDPVDEKVIHALAAQLRHSVKTIFRLFSLNPAAVNALKDLKNERSFEANAMIEEMHTLRALLFEKLLTAPSEEKEKRKYLKQIVTREMKSSEMGRKLQEELKKALDDKENEVTSSLRVSFLDNKLCNCEWNH